MDNLILESLERYFNTLEKYGYAPYNKTTDLLVLLHIDRLKSKDFEHIIKDEDKICMTNIVQCITERNYLVPTINE